MLALGGAGTDAGHGGTSFGRPPSKAEHGGPAVPAVPPRGPPILLTRRKSYEPIVAASHRRRRGRSDRLRRGAAARLPHRRRPDRGGEGPARRGRGIVP